MIASDQACQLVQLSSQILGLSIFTFVIQPFKGIGENNGPHKQLLFCKWFSEIWSESPKQGLFSLDTCSIIEQLEIKI